MYFKSIFSALNKNTFFFFFLNVVSSMFHLFKFSLLRQYFICHHECCPLVNEIVIQATKLKPVGLSNPALKTIL